MTSHPFSSTASTTSGMEVPDEPSTAILNLVTTVDARIFNAENGEWVFSLKLLGTVIRQVMEDAVDRNLKAAPGQVT